MGWKRKIIPKGEFFVESFDTMQKYLDYYWINERSFYLQLKTWNCCIIYHKIRRTNREWIHWKKIYIKTIELIKMLHMNGNINMYDENFKWGKHQHKPIGWLTKIPLLSKNVREEINEKVLQQVMDIVQDQWSVEDKKIAEGFKSS